MRRVIFSVVLMIGVGFAATALAGAPAVSPLATTVTHGEFAQMLLQTLATRQAPELIPAAALQRAQNLGLVPREWKSEDSLTQGDLGRIFATARIPYTAMNPQEMLSRPTVQKLLSEEVGPLREQASKNLGQTMRSMGPSTHTISISDF